MKRIKIYGDRRSGKTNIAVDLLISTYDPIRIEERNSYTIDRTNILFVFHKGVADYIKTLIEVKRKKYPNTNYPDFEVVVVKDNYFLKFEDHIRGKRFNRIIIDTDNMVFLNESDRRMLENYCEQLIEI